MFGMVIGYPRRCPVSTQRREENAMPSPIRIALRIPGTSPLPELVNLIQAVEDAGFDGAGILDSQLLCRDAFITLALAASQTSRMTLFPAVTNPFTRHVSVLASGLQSAEELAPGRVQCVIGTGYTSAHTIGRKPATLAEMRQTIVDLQALLNGDAITFHATSGRLQFASGRRIPVLMAASGPRSIELAGEVADGVMLLVGFTPGIVNAALERLEHGARRSGRRLEDLEIIWAARTGTASSTAEARRQARPTAVHWGLMHGGGHWLQHAGLDLPPFEIPQAVRDIYPDLGHAADWEQAIAATSFVSDEVIAQLCDALGLIGTPEYCGQRIAEMSQHGVNNLYLMTLQTFVGPERELEAFREVVFPQLTAAGHR
jgi:5,10-methylenetetrahydromethanopterin reductase